MNPIHSKIPGVSLFVFILVLACAGRVPQAAGVEIVSSEFRSDREFPQLLPYILDGWDLKHGMGPEKPYAAIVPAGAVLALTARNTSAQPISIEAVTLDGIDLVKQITPSGKEHRDLRASSYLLNSAEVTPPGLRERLDGLGQPVWFQVRPNPVAPGGFAEVTVRLARIPVATDVALGIQAKEGASAVVRLSTRGSSSLAIATVCFNDSIDRAYIDCRHRAGDDFEIKTVRLDGNPVELSGGSPRKSAHGFLPIEVPLNPPWEYGSFHHVYVATAAGDTAATVVRARDAFFALGMWGYRNNGNSEMERARDTCAAFRDHGFNTHMGMAGGQMGSLNGPEGHRMLDDMGLRLMAADPTKQDLRWPGLYARFLLDEPDAHEAAIQDLPPTRRLGAYAQGIVERQRDWTEADPRTLDLLNVDLTYKPENWLTYGRLPDILSADPYYQMRLLDSYSKHPGWLARDCAPYYVFAISEVARWAAEPRPFHAILNSVSYRGKDHAFRYGTPEEKRIEFYYALAAGAKGISYWWFTPYGEYRGCGSDDPGARAMMDEMARLNVEARALGPLLARAHPAAESAAATDPFVDVRPPWLMARTLFAGPGTMLIVLVNRDHASDREGTLFEPIEKAPLTVTPPPWLTVADAFRLTRDGVKPLSFAADEKGGLAATIEDIQLTEIVVLTNDAAPRGEVERRWAEARGTRDPKESKGPKGPK